MNCPKCDGQTVKNGKTPTGRQRYLCKLCGRRTTVIGAASGSSTIDKGKVSHVVAGIRRLRKVTPVQRWVITSAQNNTPVHQGFFNSLVRYCSHNTASLIVIPVRYKNPTGWDDRHSTDDYWWPSEVLRFLLNKDMILNKHLKLMAAIKIQATASDPLTGLDTISGTRSGIFGHAQLRMKMIATPGSQLPKMLHTTGSVSQKNYSDTKAGAKGKHHHSNSALIVEVVGDTFHVRQLTASSNGTFYDLDKLYTPKEVTSDHRLEALVTGDEHAMFMSPEVRRATYEGAGSMVGVLRPKVLVRHDVLDFYSQNHHHRRARLLQHVKAVSGCHDVRAELDGVMAMIDETTPKGVESLIVSSNHNAALMRWLDEYKPDRDPYNALIYHELCSAVYAEAKMGAGGLCSPDPLEVYSRGKLKCKHRFLPDRKSHLIKSIDVSQHGDRGANGARGAINSFAASEHKMIIGHSHTPGIRFGAYQVGTSTHLDLDYNRGMSSWMQTHCGIYPNGKRVLINIVKGEWRS